MTSEQILNYIFGGGFLTVVGTWWWNRHKPRIDRQVTTVEGLASLVDRQQREIEGKDETIKDERARATAADERARHAEGRNDELLRENGALGEKFNALLGLYLATVEGIVTGSVPPFLNPPYVLSTVITPDLIPRWPERHFDTGVPGVDPNPPFPDPPAPPGDGTDPTAQH